MQKNTLLINLIVASMVILTGCATTSSEEMLKITSPAHEQTVSSLQPTLQWAPSSKSGVSYDLIIFVPDETDSKKNVTVYYREGLTETTHKIEEALKPGTEYQWSVRTREGDNLGEYSKTESQTFTGISYHRHSNYMKFTTP